VCSKSSAALRFSGWGGEGGGLVDAGQRNDNDKRNKRTPARPGPCDPLLHHGRVPLVEAEEAGAVGVVAKVFSLSASGRCVHWRCVATVLFELNQGEIVGWLLTISLESLIPRVGSLSLVCAFPCTWTGLGILGLSPYLPQCEPLSTSQRSPRWGKEGLEFSQDRDDRCQWPDSLSDGEKKVN